MDDNEELVTLEEAKNETTIDYRKKKRRILFLLLAYSAIFGVIPIFLPEENRLLDFLVGLPLLLLGVSWCFTDAAEHDHRIGQLVRLVLILVFFVGLPIYLVQTRGFGAFKTIGLTLLLVAALFFCGFVTEFLTLYLGDVAGFWEFVC